MSQESNLLKDVGIFKSAAGGCSCGGVKFTYRIPMRITDKIIPLFNSFGEFNTDSATSHILIINTDKYKISVIKRLRDIQFTLKDQSDIETQKAFESILINIVQEAAKE